MRRLYGCDKGLFYLRCGAMKKFDVWPDLMFPFVNSIEIFNVIFRASNFTDDTNVRVSVTSKCGDLFLENYGKNYLPMTSASGEKKKGIYSKFKTHLKIEHFCEKVRTSFRLD